MINIKTIEKGCVIFNGKKTRIVDVKIIDDYSVHLTNESGGEICLINDDTEIDGHQFDSVGSLFWYVKQKVISGYPIELMSKNSKAENKSPNENKPKKKRVFKISWGRKFLIKIKSIKNNLCRH